MLFHHALARRCFAFSAVCFVVAMTSCGTDDGLGKRYSVSGTVTYNGNPLEKGKISFVPDDPKSVGASGIIENGSYRLSTGGGDDGARAGKYKVTITAKEDATAKAQADFNKASKGAAGPGHIPGQFMAKAEAQAKSLIPTGYGDINTTTLTAEVKEQSNTIDFKLSDAEAPPEPKATTKGGGRKGP
jgi:hypothetical protein